MFTIICRNSCNVTKKHFIVHTGDTALGRGRPCFIKLLTGNSVSRNYLFIFHISYPLSMIRRDYVSAASALWVDNSSPVGGHSKTQAYAVAP